MVKITAKTTCTFVMNNITCSIKSGKEYDVNEDIAKYLISSKKASYVEENGSNKSKKTNSGSNKGKSF